MPRLVVQVAVERLQSRTEDQQCPAWPQHPRGEAELGGVVLDVLQHVQVEHGVEAAVVMPDVVRERFAVDCHTVAERRVCRQRLDHIVRRLDRHESAVRVPVRQLAGDRAGAGADLEDPATEVDVELVQDPVEEVVRGAEALQVVGGTEVVVMKRPSRGREPPLAGEVDTSPEGAQVGGEVPDVAQSQAPR